MFCIACTLKTSFAQVEGILTYENVYDDKLGLGKLPQLFTKQSKARIESTNAQTKSAFGAPSTKDQNVILFDFDKSNETHLDSKRNMAIVTAFTMSSMEQQMKAMGTEMTVQNLGAEKVGNYNCTHYVMTSSSSKYKNLPPGKKEFWITNDLGTTNLFLLDNIFIIH